MLVKNARVYVNKAFSFEKSGVLIRDGIIADIAR